VAPIQERSCLGERGINKEACNAKSGRAKAAKALRIDANQQIPHSESGPGTIAELVAHYRLKELVGENQGRKSFSTRAGYESYLNGWILPRKPFVG
jgi:hypothetical protein